MNKYKRFVVDAGYRFGVLASWGIYDRLPDEAYIRKRYRSMFHKKLDLCNPQTFNEKLQWLKLYDRNPLYTTLVDKYAVREYLAEKIGGEYLIPLVGGPWKSFEEIDFDRLPEQFVLKCTHDSGGVVICRDKGQFDYEGAKKKLERCLGRNYYTRSREWPYKNVPPRIIAEKYMVDESGEELKDYKFFMFSGKAALIQVDYGRFSQHKRNLYLPDWKYLDASIKYPNDPEYVIPKPKKLDLMIHLAEVLSEGLPHVRVDFYSINTEVFVGELTFYHESGFAKFTPDELGKWLGEQLVLPRGEHGVQ